MTNANVEQTVAGVDGQLLTLKYKDGEKKILVTPDTIIVTYVPGDKGEITPGTKIFIAAAKKQEDGTFQTPPHQLRQERARATVLRDQLF